MTWHPATADPTAPGWYACRLHLSVRPVVLYWGEHSTQWRAGCVLQQVTAWLGPL